MSYAKLKSEWLVATLLLSIGPGGGWGLNHVMGAEPDIVGYVLQVEKGGFLVTGQEPRGFDTAVLYSLKNAQKAVRVGEQVKVWSLAMAESYPGQAAAEKVEVLDGKKPEKSGLTRAAAVQKAIEDLKPGRELYVTFVKQATYDEETQAWKISINVGRTVGGEEAVKAVDIEVSGDGRTVRKRERRMAAKEPPARKEPQRVQTDAEARESELALIAESQGWSKEGAAAVMKSQQALNDVVSEITTAFPKAFTGAVHAAGPADEPRILIKGPVTREIREMVSKAPIKIKIIDNQPYSATELETLQAQVFKTLEKQGYEVLGGHLDIEPKCRVHVTIREKKGLPCSVDGVLKLLPRNVASVVDLKLQPAPVVIREQEKEEQ